jgi:hypothetical protein
LENDLGESPVLQSKGYLITQVDLPETIRKAVVTRSWVELDRLMAREVKAGGRIYDKLRGYADFSEIEFIIAIRSSLEEPDEDGIWHDDGTRLLAFSLSLTLDHENIEGGRLEIRKIHPDPAASEWISTPCFGTLIVFATGQQGFEHKINRVTHGERIIIAGWCT